MRKPVVLTLTIVVGVFAVTAALTLVAQRDGLAQQNSLAQQNMVRGSMAQGNMEQQDRSMLKVPGGLAFSEFKGYEGWQDIAVSETKTSVKAILGNAAMIKAYKEGIPENGKAFPEGAKAVKIEWLKKQNPVSPYFVEIPDTLASLSFAEKDLKRFPKTHGWAFAKFTYDNGTKTLKPSVTGFECGYACHTKVAARDYIFSAYPVR
ncbi:MAG: cytochrome P460 family protein [Acidobacteriaceae bacterium]